MVDICDDGPRFWCPTRLYHSTVSGIRARNYRYLYENVLEKKYKLSENDAYLFINDKLKQAVVSFVSIQIKPADLFNDDIKN